METASCVNGEARSTAALILAVIVKYALLFEVRRSLRPLRHPPLWKIHVSYLLADKTPHSVPVTWTGGRSITRGRL